MSARSRRRRRRALAKLRSVVALFLAMGVLGGMVYLYAAHRPPPVDPKTLCRTDAPLAGHTILLIDASDPLSPLEADRVRALASAQREKLPRFDKLTVLSLSTKKPFEPVVGFSKCSPGSGISVNPWLENGDQIKQRFNAAIEKPLDRRLSRAVKAKGAKTSPILETLAAVARRYDFTPTVSRRRLIVVSDLLQHNPNGYSHYGTTPPSFAALNADPVWWQLKARFDGVDVVLEYVPRANDASLQTETHRQFWRDYFNAAGARSIAFLDEQPTAGW